MFVAANQQNPVKFATLFPAKLRLSLQYKALWNTNAFKIFKKELLFGFRFYIPVNSYVHVEMVSSHNPTFYWVSLAKR